MNDNYIVLNDTVKLFYEDGFHVMEEAELANLRSPWQGPMQGLSDPARHIMRSGDGSVIDGWPSFRRTLL